MYSLALDGHAPKFFRKTTRNGVPIYCFCITMCFTLLGFLCVSGGAAQGVKWLANVTQAAQLLDYIFMCTIYLFFYRALKAQGYDRNKLPYKGWGQPYVAIFGLIFFTVILCIYGYATFYAFDIGTFFTYYAMCFVCIITWTGWKLIKRSKFVKPEEADLVWERPKIDAYEASIDPPLGLWWDIFYSITFQRKKKMNMIRERRLSATAPGEATVGTNY